MIFWTNVWPIMNRWLLFLGLCFLLTANSAVAGTEHVIYSFNGASDGGYPTSLISDTAGNLYGTTAFTTNYGPGTIFELVKNGSTYDFVVLYTFTDGGLSASGPVALDAQGNLYGTTSTGGDNFKGSVFELSPVHGSWKLTVLYSFTAGEDGGYPSGGVVVGKTGILYGTASQGGLLSDCSGVGCGVVFELSPQAGGTWTETVLHSFAQTEGALPSGLILPANGILYGAANLGGTGTYCQGSPANGCGTVFELVPSAGGWKEITLHSFDVNDGAFPQGVTAYHGSLFGATNSGGTQGAGTIFELTPTKSGVIESVIHNFALGRDVTQPMGTVVFDKEGNLYGSASKGGDSACFQGCGGIFELIPSNGTWTEKLLHEFTDGSDGAVPDSTPTLTGAGIFGIASEGGTNGYGVVFELSR